MLAMPVPTTIVSVADSISAALVSGSRPMTSGTHRVP